MYFKLKDVTQFEFTAFKRTLFVMWDDANKTFLKSDTWLQGYSKKHTCEIRTEKDTGLIDFSNAQFAEILANSWDGQIADPKGKFFTVKTNGQQGKEIRYFINLFQQKQELPVINVGEPTETQPPANVEEIVKEYKGKEVETEFGGTESDKPMPGESPMW